MMEPLKIVTYPERILRARCTEINVVTGEERALFDKMLFTMRCFSGIGLAAPQIGVEKRMFVCDVGSDVVKMADPHIEKRSGGDRMEEGCLSVPDVSVTVKRPYKITVVGLNEKGEKAEIKAEGLLARVIQHEIDHLDGKLIIDYMNIIRRMKYGIKKR